MIQKIIAGGVTGTERAVLDYALSQGIPCTGWCPKGRITEDGEISDKYPVKETHGSELKESSLRNVMDSEGILVITKGQTSGNPAFTVETAFEHRKPFFLLNLSRGFALTDLLSWLERFKIKVLHISGPSESQIPGIAGITHDILSSIFDPINTKPDSTIEGLSTSINS